MALLHVSSDSDGRALLVTDYLFDLVQKVQPYAVSADTDQTLWFLCKHPTTGEVAVHSVEDIVRALEIKERNEQGATDNVVPFRKPKGTNE